MDIEKLIEKLNDFNENHISVFCGSGQCACGYLCAKDDCIVVRAATALSTLRAENEKLRADLEYEREHADAYYEECGQWEAENEKLRDELEQVKAERDAAVGDIYSGNANDCDTCLHGCDYNNDCPLETGGECKYKWRGLQREN